MTEYTKLIFKVGCKAFHSSTPDILVNHTRMSATVGEYGCTRITKDAEGGFDVVGEEHEGKPQHFWCSDANVVWGVKLHSPLGNAERLGPASDAQTKAELFEDLGRELIRPMLQSERQEDWENAIAELELLNRGNSDLPPDNPKDVKDLTPKKKKAGRPKKNG